MDRGWTAIDSPLLDRRSYAPGGLRGTFRVLRDEEPIESTEHPSSGRHDNEAFRLDGQLGVVEHAAAPLPAEVILRLLGVPEKPDRIADRIMTGCTEMREHVTPRTVQAPATA